MARHRFRRFNTGPYYPRQEITNEMCMAVRAGNLVFLRGQTGYTLDGDFVGVGGAAAQAEQAMQNVRVLLEETGARMEHICKIATHITDRAYRSSVYQVVGRHLGNIGYPLHSSEFGICADLPMFTMALYDAGRMATAC